jgi:retron-type reverse transcriptase
MNNEFAIITPYGLTNSFQTDLGTRQRAVLSPFLFSLVISPLINELRELGFGIRLGNILIPGLFYADDIVLLAENPRQMQSMLNHASSFLRNWRFTVNAKKSEIVIFAKEFLSSAELHKCTWALSGSILKIVDFYKYLGLIFQGDGKWNMTLDANI